MPTSPALTEYLFTQGVLGFTTFVFLGGVAFLWRSRESLRTQLEDDHKEELAAERTRHSVEIVAERKLNAELQDARVNELRAALDAVKAVTSTVDSALLVLRGRD